MISSDIQKKVVQLQEYMDKLSEYAAFSTDEVLMDEQKRLAMERLFLLMVDEAVDINAAVAYQLGGRIAESYKSSFHELVPLHLLAPGFAEKIAESAKIRNQLTHDYETLQKREAIENMKKFYELYKEYVRVLIEKLFVANDKESKHP